MPVSPEQSDQASLLLMDPELEAERIHNVNVLVENLFEREETTVKKILDYLYDVGADSLIDERLRRSFLKKLAHSATGLSKPAFRVIAWRWFRKNCPELITKWLHKKIKSQVQKKKKQALPSTPALSRLESTSDSQKLTKVLETQDLAALPPAVMEVALLSLTEAENRSREVVRLQSRVKTLTSALAGTIIILGGAVLWMGHGFLTDTIQVNQSQGSVTAKEAQRTR